MFHARQICIIGNGKRQCIPLADPFELNRIKDEQDVERLYRFFKNAIEADDNIEANIIIEVKEKKPGFAFELLLESAKAPDTDALLQKLTKRQREVLHLLCEGLDDKAIAKALFISLPTVKSHNRKIFDKLQLHGRTKVILTGRERNW